MLDLFVNNEKTLLKIYEALFPHRTAKIMGSEQMLPPATGYSNQMSPLRDDDFGHGRNKTSIQLATGTAQTSNAMGNTFLPLPSSGTAGQRTRPSPFSRTSQNVSKSMNSKGYAQRNNLASASQTARNQQLLESLSKESHPMNLGSNRKQLPAL